MISEPPRLNFVNLAGLTAWPEGTTREQIRQKIIAQRTALLTWVCRNFYNPRDAAEMEQYEHRGLFVPKSQRPTTPGSLRHTYFPSAGMRIHRSPRYFRVYGVGNGIAITYFFVHRRKGTLHRPDSEGRPGQAMYDLRVWEEFCQAVRGCKRKTSIFERQAFMPFLYQTYRRQEPSRESMFSAKIAATALSVIAKTYNCGMTPEMLDRLYQTDVCNDCPFAFDSFWGTTPWEIASMGRIGAHHHMAASYIGYVYEMKRLMDEYRHVQGDNFDGTALDDLDRADPEYFSETLNRQNFRMKSPHHISFDHERERRRTIWSRPVIYPDHPIYEGEPREPFRTRIPDRKAVDHRNPRQVVENVGLQIKPNR